MEQVPDFQSMMLPFLQLMEDGKEHGTKDMLKPLADKLQLTETQRTLKHEKSGQPIFQNNLTWVVTYLAKAGLLLRPRRGFFTISDEGKNILKDPPDRIDIKFLKQLNPSFADWLSQRTRPKQKTGDEPNIGVADDETCETIISKTPDEILEETYSLICRDLADDLLEQVRQASWQFFERLVVDVITKMGYGGSRQDAGKVVGKSGDNGIDGLINEDKLGLDVLYIQAKKYDGPIPVSQVRDFAGALLAKKARKGIFITTSTFPKSAIEFVAQIEPRIILIDGERLAQLMIEHNVGVSIKETYEIKRIDNDYFEDIIL